jgi:hypothetical protein
MFWLLPLISGLGTWAATGDFKKGLMSGLLGAGIGGIAGAFGNAASSAASTAGSAIKDVSNVSNLMNGVSSAAQGVGAGVGAAANGLNGIQAVGQATNGASQSGNLMRMGADFLARKPVTSGLLLSSLVSAADAPKVEGQEKPKGERFKDEMSVVPRETLPFTGQPPPGPSTYVRNEPFTPDNPYRYGQYEGEKMFFDNPGLARASDGGLPPLPGPVGEDEDNDRIRGILGIIRGRGQHAFSGGGRIRGPGDGQSDNVPARGPGMDILLSDGEFVIPADVVSALGAGSSDAGAKRLESAMSKIRTMSYGSSKQARRPGRVSL